MVDLFQQVCFTHIIHMVFFLTLISGTSSGKPIGEPSQGIVKDGAYSNKTSQQRKVRK